MPTMKITVPLTIEVDTDEWTRAYGVEGAGRIREDVRLYVLNGVQNMPPAEEGGFVAGGTRLALPNRLARGHVGNGGCG